MDYAFEFQVLSETRFKFDKIGGTKVILGLISLSFMEKCINFRIPKFVALYYQLNIFIYKKLKIHFLVLK